jgi:hypothetical protein
VRAANRRFEVPAGNIALLPGDDFELHQVLLEIAPAAVCKLVELGRSSDVSKEVRDAALIRLREMQTSGLFEHLPVDLRREADSLLDAGA